MSEAGISAEEICQHIRALDADSAHQLAVANAYAAELEQRLVILSKRLEHADIEMAQARVSRDSYKSKVLTLMGAMEAQGITLEVEGRELSYHWVGAVVRSEDGGVSRSIWPSKAGPAEVLLNADNVLARGQL